MQPSPLNAEELLDQEFLVVRAKILEIAAALDRLDRGDGDAGDHPRSHPHGHPRNDPRTEKLHEGLEALLSREQNRAERIQQIFSLPYDEGWRKMMD